MAKKIVDETLKFSIVINGDSAKKEYGQLERQNRSLLESNKDLEAQAKKLAKAGKEQSDEYKKLIEDIDKNSKAVTNNKTRMQQLTNEIGINNLTMRQLSKEAARLNAIMSNLDPQSAEWKKYNLELQSIRGRQSNLRQEMSATSETMGEQTGFLSKLKKGFNDLVLPISGALLFADALKTGIAFAKEFVVDAIKISTEAKGVEFAFKRLGVEGEEAFLKVKTATRGLLSDLEIKKSLVEFDNFNISLDESASLFEFLTIRAQQTGSSMDYLKQSMVEGLSKESKLRIDNLGISTAALNEELKKTPNFVQAVANIAKTEIARAGNILDEASNSTQRWEASLENTKLQLGNMITSSGVIPFFQKIGLSILDAVTPAESLTKQFQDQQEAFIDLQSTLPPLIDEYDKLKGKSNLTADEQDRLKTIITQIGNIAPGVITQFDDYGNALDISSAKARDFIETQKAVLAYQNQEALKETKKQLANYQEDLKRKQKALQFQTTRSANTDYEKSVVSENITKLSAEVAKLKQLEIGALETVDQLSGDYLSKEIERKKKLTATELKELQVRAQALNISIENKTAAELKAAIAKKTAPKTPEEESRIAEAAKAAKNTADLFKKAEEELTKIILDERSKRAIAGLAGIEKEKAEIDAKYAGNIEKFKEHTAKVKELEALRDEEKKALEIQRQQELAAQLQLMEEENWVAEEALRLEREAEAAVTAEEKQLLLIQRAQLIAQQELDVEQWKAEEKLRINGATEAEISALKTKHLTQQQALDLNFSKAKNALKKDEVVWTNLTEKQKLNIIVGALGNAATAFNEGSAAWKAVKIAETTITTYQSAIESYKSLAGIPMVGPALGAVAAGLAVASGLASVKKIASTPLAKIPQPKTEGFEGGLYPVTRKQDGKKYKAGINGSQTQIANSPTILVGERPEMVIDPDTFKKMDPQIVDYIMNLSGRGVPGYETGSYPANAQASSPESPKNNNQLQAMTVDVLTSLNNQLANGITAIVKYGIENEIERQGIQDKLTATKLASKN